MNESEVIQHIAAILLGVLFCAPMLFVMLLPQIDRLVDRRKKKTRIILPNYTAPRGKDRSP